MQKDDAHTRRTCVTMSGTAIILTDGKAGHENQSKAFARALGLIQQSISLLNWMKI